MVIKKRVFVAIIVVFFSIAASQETDTIPEYQINPTRLAIIGGSIATSYTAAYLIFLKEGWWAKSEPFKFEPLSNDFYYASNLDKFGHFYTGALFSELFAMSYDWVGMSPFASSLWAGITVSFTQILVEFKDGFAPYGYSVWDAAAGTLGGFYAMGKRYIPAMQYIDYKFIYFPNYKGYWRDTKANGGENMGGPLTGSEGVFVDDYYGGNQTHWLSFKVAKMLPSEAREYYPQWLALAFGLGIDNGRYERKKENGSYGKSRYEFYASLDYDAEAIIHPQQTWSKNIVKILNLIKFPAPAVRFGSNAKFFPLHPMYSFSVSF
jgi:hypothetical protein